MIRVEEICWLEGSNTNVEPEIKEKLERVLEENPLCSVLDIEEKQIQIKRFAFTDFAERQTIYYIELDTRIQLSKDEYQVKRIVDCNCLLEAVFMRFQHFARKIRVD